MKVYADWAATEPMWPEAVDAYANAVTTVGNPSSIHRDGQHARALVDEAKVRIAEAVGADPMEVMFTSGATESINTWVKGRVFHARSRGVNPVVLSTRAEHHATLDALVWLEAMGLAEVAWVDVDSRGVIEVDMVDDLLTGPLSPRIVGVTMLAANNEVGSLQPVDDIIDRATRAGIPVHVDAVGMFGHLPFPWKNRGLDAMSFSAHKVGGPVGVGALIVSRQAKPFESLIHGGTQQTHRSGTLDAAGATAFAAAVELQLAKRDEEAIRLAALREKLKAGIDQAVSGVVWRGDPLERLPHNLHLTVSGCEGDTLLFLLDERGVSVSTGSACQAGVPEPSHVLLAMGVEEKTAKGALRFTLGRTTTQAHIDYLIEVFPEVVSLARAAAP
jgi:cysteine desulfurase